MRAPTVSVIIPAYNQAKYLEQTIQSVVNQTLADWELIIVDDGSTDITPEVVRRFDDPRIKYVYQANRGLPAARNVGVRHSLGRYIAFLDADDLYLPQQLMQQVAHLEHDPTIGVSYASRVEIDEDGQRLTMIKAPEAVDLVDLVLWFPFQVSSVVMQREWWSQVKGFDESFVLNSEDRDFFLRLRLEGCRFAGLSSFLTHRRIYHRRVFTRVGDKLQEMLRALRTAFDTPSCPSDVLKLRNKALANVYLPWAYQELTQEETALGQHHLGLALKYDPLLQRDGYAPVWDYLVAASVRCGEDHEEELRLVIEQLPREMAVTAERSNWAIGRGYLMRGAMDAMWGRPIEARANFRAAAARDARIDASYINLVVAWLRTYEMEYGASAVAKALTVLSTHLRQNNAGHAASRIKASLSINQAFDALSRSRPKDALRQALEGVVHDPAYLLNRGVLSTIGRSTILTCFPRASSRGTSGVG